jgi:hypothetical protein
MRAPEALCVLVIGFGATLASCQPDFGATGSIIAEQTMLAIKAEPAEAPPGQPVTYRALVVSPSGSVDNAPLEWAYCTAPRPLSEDNVVSAACLGDSASVSIGSGASATAPVPADACARFGPDEPPQPVGMPPLRPTDPDVTGGYYQPLRARLGDQTAFGLERIACNLAGASADIAAAYQMTYTANRNPSIIGLTAFVGDQPVDLTAIAPGTDIRLVATWTADSSETYPVYDPATNTLVERQEALRVSWYATAGQFETDRTGANRTGDATSTENGWTSPDGMSAHLWIVLHDDRGGVDFADYEIITRGPR